MAWYDALRRLVGLEVRNDTAGMTPMQFAEFLGLAGTFAGRTVSPETAMQAIAVQACTTLIAGGVICMPLRVNKRSYEGGRLLLRPIDDHPYWWMFNEQAGPDSTAAQLWTRLTLHKLLFGESFARIIRRPKSNEVLGLVFQHNRDVMIERAWDPTWRMYRIVRYLVNVAGNFFGVSPDDMLHFEGEKPLDDPTRYAITVSGGTMQSAILDGARQAIGISLAIEEYCGRFFTNGGMPKIVLSHPNTMKDEQIEQLRRMWVERYGGAGNAHMPLVLANGTKADKISATAEEAQLLETRAYQVVEIARAFRVPGFMIGETANTTSWGSGIEQMSKGFVRYTLRPHTNAFEQEINRKLFGIDRYAVDFDEEALERGDMQSLGTWFRAALGGSAGPGFMTSNDVRQRVGLPPIDGGTSLFTPAGGTSDASNAPDEPAEPAGRPKPEPAAPLRGPSPGGQ
ncbi:MAG TPA: phage portal protein [Steroidobacteraceae bacterium]|nr:phage portal protein [Steroidobacteraceae bacterium]